MKEIDFCDWCMYDKKGKTFFYKGCKYTLCDYAERVDQQSCYVVYNHDTKRHYLWQWYIKRNILVNIND